MKNRALSPEEIRRLARTMAATPVEFVGNDGKTYKLTAMTPGDMGAMEEWLRQQPLVRLREELSTLGPVLTTEERRALIATARDESAQIVGMDDESKKKYLSSVDGMIQWLYLSLRRNHSDITVEKTRELVTLENIATLQELLDQLNDLGGDDPEGDPREKA